MRSRTRTTFVVMVVLAMVAALAPAAFGKPPTDKPGKDPGALSVQVEAVGAHEPAAPYVYEDGALGYPFYWVNAMGDQLRFVVTIDGPTEGTISWAFGEGGSIEGSFAEPLLIPPRDHAPYTVDAITEVQAKVRGQMQLVQSVDVEFTVDAAGWDTMVVPFTLDADLEPDCKDAGLADMGLVEGRQTYVGTPLEDCRWVPSAMGYWKAELAWAGDSSRMPPSIGATLRDHVPGNWCTTDPYNAPGGVGGDPRQTEPVTGWFYLPETGICLGGGAGGYTMAAGTTTDFFLVTSDTDVEITLSGPYTEIP